MKKSTTSSRFTFAILLAVSAACIGGAEHNEDLVPAQDGGVSGLCSNGTVDPGEECDSSVNASVTCESIGFGSGVIRCGAD